MKDNNTLKLELFVLLIFGSTILSLCTKNDIQYE